MVRISWDIAGEINWVILYNMLLCKESLTGHAFQNGMKACTLLDERQVVSPFIASSRLKYRLSHTHLLQALFTNKIIKTQVSGMSFGEWNKIWCKDCYDLPHPPTLFFLWIKKAYFWWITIYHTIKFLSVKSPRPEGTTLFFFYGTPSPNQGPCPPTSTAAPTSWRDCGREMPLGEAGVRHSKGCTSALGDGSRLGGSSHLWTHSPK